jgi:hypothetical protein
MRLFLGDMISPINCELIDHEELQAKDKNKKEFCGLYIADENKIYISNNYPNIPTLDILLHEISHVLIGDLSIYKSEEQKADMLAIRIKKVLEQKKKIYAFVKNG